MPVCVQCAAPADHLYTVYRTRSNIRLGACTQCDGFLDPLIEHPGLIVFIDLVLLKPRAYLHLLYNRGTLPLDAAQQDAASKEKQTRTARESSESRLAVLWSDLYKLVLATVLGETLSRIQLHARSDSHITTSSALWTAASIFVETAIQHLASTALALAFLWHRGWLPSNADMKAAGVKPRSSRAKVTDGRQPDFRSILIPLTILYTSIVPLLFQLLLSIWYNPPDPAVTRNPPSHADLLALLGGIAQHLPPAAMDQLFEAMRTVFVLWNTTDLVWAGTRLLGGLSAGFGLRVALPTKPWETSAIVLVGWTGAALTRNWMVTWI